MSISLLFGEMQTIAALHDTNAKINAALGQRSELAGRLDTDLLTNVDWVTINGENKQIKATDWTRYHGLRGIVIRLLNQLMALKKSLVERLDRYQQMRERDRVSQQNALDGGYGIFG